MIRIITDSLCDLTMEYAKEINIDILPLNVCFGEEEYKCGIELSNEDFYTKLEENSTPPSTSAVYGMERFYLCKIQKRFCEYFIRRKAYRKIQIYGRLCNYQSDDCKEG